MYGAAAKPELVTIQPLDNERNPYRNKYEPWDAWVYRHAVASSDPAIERYFREEGGRSNYVIYAYVDSSGFLVPQRMAEEYRLHSWAVDSDTRPAFLPDWTHILYAAGPIDPVLLRDYEQAMLGLRAEYTVSIPSWLAVEPPAWALILPPEAGKHAGEVVMFGLPGAGQDYALPPGEIRPPTARSVYYRYSADGRELGHTVVGQQWWELYTSNPAAPGAGGTGSYYRVFEALGIISVIDSRTAKLAWRMDLDGTHIREVAVPQQPNANHWLGLTAREVKIIYALQRGQPLPGTDASKPKSKPKPKPLGGSRG